MKEKRNAYSIMGIKPENKASLLR